MSSVDCTGIGAKGGDGGGLVRHGSKIVGSTSNNHNAENREVSFYMGWCSVAGKKGHQQKGKKENVQILRRLWLGGRSMVGSESSDAMGGVDHMHAGERVGTDAASEAREFQRWLRNVPPQNFCRLMFCLL